MFRGEHYEGNVRTPSHEISFRNNNCVEYVTCSTLCYFIFTLCETYGRSVTLSDGATFPHSVAQSMDRVSTWLTRVDDRHLSSASSSLSSSSSSPCVAQSNKRGTHQPALCRCDTTPPGPAWPGTAAVTDPSPLPVTATRSPAGRRLGLTALTMIDEDFDHLISLTR